MLGLLLCLWVLFQSQVLRQRIPSSIDNVEIPNPPRKYKSTMGSFIQGFISAADPHRNPVYDIEIDAGILSP